jgi:S1-C subfamily serine protease
MRSLLRFLIFAALVALGVVVFLLGRKMASSHAPKLDAHLPMLAQLDGEITTLVGRVVPSVVSITARLDNSAVDPIERLQRMFMGVADQQPSDLGSGVIVSPEGHILTNWHVVQNASRVDVQLSDGRTMPAKFLGADQEVDLAVLKIDAAGLHPLAFADSNRVRVGQIVFAVGNPLGLQETVTQGIVSGKGRRAVSGLTTDFFQTDAAINKGNSGGPLVNVKGEIIGISNAVLVGSAGISFAIPSNVAMRVYDDVVKRGRISRPWFGAITLPVTPQIATQFDLGVASGNLVQSVVRGSPAERAGIQPWDVIEAFNGAPVRDSVDIANRLSEMKEGERVKVTVWRKGKRLQIPVTVERQPWQ